MNSNEQFLSPEWDNISVQAKDLVTKMLTINPAQRPSVEECLAHEWLRSADATNTLGTTLAELKKFNARRRFKRGILAVRSANILKSFGNVASQKRSVAAGNEALTSFRVLESTLKDNLKAIEAASLHIDEQASELLKHPEQKIEAVPVIENIFKTISALEKDIKILRKASAKLILSNEASAISEYL